MQLSRTATRQYRLRVLIAGQLVQTPVNGSNRSTDDKQLAPSYPPQTYSNPSNAQVPRLRVETFDIASN